MVNHSLILKDRRVFPYKDSFHPNKVGNNEIIAPISIGDDVWIGAGSIVLPGVTIGSGATIGAGSLFTIQFISRLRDIMATSAWEFYEQEEMLDRYGLNMNYWEDNIVKRYENYPRGRKDPISVRKFESERVYHSKGQVAYEEAFSHLNTIIPTEQSFFI